MSYNILILDKHEIISDIKRVASEIGHPPSRREYREHGRYAGSIETHFGLWTNAIKAAFGDVSKERSYSPIRDILDHHKSIPKHVVEVDSDFPIVVFGDTHHPFASDAALSNAYLVLEQIQKQNQVKHVVQVGDLTDQFAQAKFPRTHNCYSPKEEMQLAYEHSVAMWKTIKKIVGDKAKCWQLWGNHDLRVIKRVFEQAPTLEHLVDIKKYMQFDGVTLIEDPRQELQIGDIKFIHGYLSKLGDHRDSLQSNVVCGHSHTGGVNFKSYGNTIKWELNVGYLGCPNSKALSYTPTQTVRWTHGLGVIDQLGPRFIPFC